jgi:Fe/S biogenesis protein NfuA
MSEIITITESAEKYLAKLLDEKKDTNMAVRVFVSDPGTPKAETCLAFCKIDEQEDQDTLIELKTLKVFVETRSIPFLEDAEINFDTDNFGGQLTIKSPNSRLPNISRDSPLEDKVNYVIYNEINPMLESHGGVVNLVEITDEGDAVLQFGGGCQGCGMVDVTLKDGIEKTLLEKFSELKSVKDITDHSLTDNAYYSES